MGVTAYLTVYHLIASRGADVVTEELLGADYKHVLTSDRFKAYNGVPLKGWRCARRFAD